MISLKSPRNRCLLTPSSLLIRRCSPKFVLSTFSPNIAANSSRLGRVCRCGNGLANKSFKKVMQSVHISSIASSSNERAYSTKNITKSVSLSDEVKVDFRDGSRAEGFVRLYIALKIAGIVCLGLEPSRTWRRLKTIGDLKSLGDLEDFCQTSTTVSRHSRASAAKRCSRSLRARFRIRREV